MRFCDSEFFRAARRSPSQVVIHTCEGCNVAGGKIRIALRVVVKMGIYVVRKLGRMNNYAARSLPSICSIFTDNKIHKLCLD